jgi:uncharacterized protein (DUF924 family)
LPAPADTTPEFWESYLRWWRQLSGEERAQRWLERISSFDDLRYERLREKHPTAAEHELLALWTEQTYRHSMPPDWVAKAVALIRARAPESPPDALPT